MDPASPSAREVGGRAEMRGERGEEGEGQQGGQWE